MHGRSTSEARRRKSGLGSAIQCPGAGKTLTFIGPYPSSRRSVIAVGLKVTVIVQLALTDRELRQVMVFAKSPLTTMVGMVSDKLPVFCRVMA